MAYPLVIVAGALTGALCALWDNRTGYPSRCCCDHDTASF